EAYEPPPADQWTTGLAEPPTQRWRATGATLGGIIYVVGGELTQGTDLCEDDVVADTVEAYVPDPEPGSWSIKSPMQTARSQVSLVADEVNNKLYAIGGSLGSQGIPRYFALPT